MIKKIIAGLSLVGMSLSAQSALLIDESNITGADMGGISVTAMFSDGTTDTGIWSAFPDVILGTGDPIADAEGFSGGVVTSTWSLTQQGFSSGNVSPGGDVYGAWTLTNLASASAIVGFSIDGSVANVAFDIDSGSEVTPYSGVGVAFASATSVDSVTYSDQVNAAYGDLFFALEVLFGSSELAIDEELVFVADTETIKVPEPATTAMILSGLLFGAARLRSRK